MNMLESLTSGPGLPSRLARRLLRELKTSVWRIRWSFRPYRHYYRQHLGRAAVNDPREAVGGLWETMGRFQLELLTGCGLKPSDRLLDFGCGSLRGGLHFTRYLDSGNYWGVDMSSELLEAGEGFLRQEGLAHKQPNLVLVDGADFDELDGLEFDFALAFGVFTDVPRDLTAELFRRISSLLAPGGVFIGTFGQSDRYIADPTVPSFWYPAEFFSQLGTEAGLSVQLLRGLGHPKGHSAFYARRQPFASG